MTTRIILGLLMLTGFAGLVSLDTQIGPPFPLLHVLFFGACLLGALEIRSLLPPEQRSHPLMILWCLGVVILAPLGIHLVSFNATGGSWIPLSCSLALALWSGFLGEMAFYRERTNALPRIAFLQMSVLYIGLPCALALQIPELFPQSPRSGLAALLLACLVPKACDIGAYFTGRFFGRTRITPVLSPKKTLEGFSGGVLLGASICALFQFYLGPTLHIFPTMGHALGFGILVSIGGILGDLAESLLKRDLHAKDASALIPGFGGILDVIDSILLGATVALGWFLVTSPT
jgi:phosphatidate cytidylyltransferase